MCEVAITLRRTMQNDHQRRELSTPATILRLATVDDAIHRAHLVAPRTFVWMQYANRHHRDCIGATIYYHKLRLREAMAPRADLAARRFGTIACTPTMG